MGRPGGPGPLDPIFDVATSYGAIAVGNSPGATNLTVTINKVAGQDDPAFVPPILFDVVFSEAVTGFTDDDVDLALSTAGGVLVPLVSGSGDTYTVSVTGMTTSGDVIARILSGRCFSVATGVPNRASTSTDNSVEWQASALENLVAWWDRSQGDLTDLIGSCDLQNTNNWLSTTTQNGLTCMHAAAFNNVAQGLNSIAPNSPVDTLSVFGITIVARNGGAQHVYFDTSGGGSTRPHAYTFGTNTINNLNAVADGASDTNWHVYYFEWNGASSKIYIDGALQVTGDPAGGAAGSSLSFMNTTIAITAGSPADIGTKWGEAKLSTGIQTPTNIAAEAAFLADKWGF
jgi:hypothetical protein